MITDRIGRQEIVLPINHKHFNFRKNRKNRKTPRTNISSGENVFCSKFLYFGNSPVFLWIIGCCYGHCDHFCDWWISWVDFVWLAASTVRLQVSSYSQLSFVVVQKTLGQRGQVSWTLIGPLHLHIYDVDYEASNNHPYSVVHHDDKPLVVRFLSQAPKAIECRQCHTEFSRRKTVIPLDIILLRKNRCTLTQTIKGKNCRRRDVQRNFIVYNAPAFWADSHTSTPPTWKFH